MGQLLLPRCKAALWPRLQGNKATSVSHSLTCSRFGRGREGILLAVGLLSFLVGSACPCTVPPKIIAEAGILYATPYEHEVRLRIRSIAGQRIGDVIERAKAHELSDCNDCNVSMFESISPDWWLNQLRQGNVRVERCGWQCVDLLTIDEDYVVQNDDRVRLMIHVHERAVPDVKIPIIYEDDNYLAVSKPAGLDVFANPSGGSVRLSVVGMLEALGYKGLLPAHRIDKPVSGVLCLARNKKAISRLQRCIKRRKVNKTYLARTKGRPHASGEKITAPLGTIMDDRGRQIAKVMDDGKASGTVIRDTLRTHKDGTSTVVVELLSGRYHQIRCHLNYAGWPIANDAVYGGTAEPTKELYTGPLAREMLEQHRLEHCHTCEYYRRVLEGTNLPPRLDPTIWLHSWRYEFPSLDLKFEAPLPQWALPEDDDMAWQCLTCLCFVHFRSFSCNLSHLIILIAFLVKTVTLLNQSWTILN